MINKRVNIYDVSLGRMCISLIKNLEKKFNSLFLKKKYPIDFHAYLALAGAIDQFSLKSVPFFKYSRVVGVHMTIKKKKLALKQAPPPPHHCVLCKKSLRELAVFKLFTILFPPFRVKILLNQSICKVSKIFHCIFINTENGAIFVPVSG